MRVQRFEVGALAANCYLIVDEETGKGALVDPGSFSPDLTEALKTLAPGNLEWILLTHGHFDHIGAADDYRKTTGAKIVISEAETDFLKNAKLNLGAQFYLPVKPFQADKTLQDGETVLLGSLLVKMLLTPGHTKGGCCYQIGNALFTGDTLMRFSIGRTDFKTGSMAQMQESLERLKALDGDSIVYPGHGDATTLQEEREHNPYLGHIDYDDFY